MRKTKSLAIVQTVLICLFTSIACAGMSSTSYRISTSVISGGGNTMSSDNFTMVSTLGQPSSLGSGTSNSYRIDAGYWYTILLTLAVGDVNGDGIVNLKDVIATLQVVTGQTVESIYLEADADEDGRIGVAESIMILRKLGGL